MCASIDTPRPAADLRPAPRALQGGDSALSLGARLGRLYRTVRWLRREQIVGQLALRVRRRWPATGAYRPVRPGFPGLRWRPVGQFLPPGSQRNDAAGLAAGEFEFLNDRREIGWPPQWNPRAAPMLWRYNLHYFEHVWALDLELARAVVLDWIERCGPSRRGCAWAPYPTSLRLQNWTAFFFGRWREAVADDPAFRDRLWASLARQAEWLRGNLETHLLGNHLWENGVALALVGACFEGKLAERWHAAGAEVLREQLAEQVLADGGHLERSPMYHVRALYTLGLLANTGDESLRTIVREPMHRMADALDAMVHPDGDIALLNDSALGVQNRPADVLQFCRAAARVNARQGPAGRTLPATGYYTGRSDARGDANYVICDAAPVGPDYLPGHAHGDIFAFELTLGGRRVVTDAGVFDYETSEDRAYCRSTRAHNTVEVAGQDQCEFWGAFRVGRRGRPHEVRYVEDTEGFRLSGWHDGYRHLPRRPVHRREFVWRDAGVLLVRDRVEVEAPGEAECVSSLHFAPGVGLEPHGPGAIRASDPHGEFFVSFAGGRVEVGESEYFPEFGRRLTRPCVRLFWRSPAGGPTAFCISLAAPASLSAAQGAVFDGAALAW